MAAIEVHGVGKRYRIGTRAARHDTLRDAIAAGVRGAAGSLATLGRGRPVEYVWALRDVAFEIPAGEVVGIIGGNGAGKSTLLKVLSRITPPTEGRAVIRGRVGALLEVGTGFHTELTGRENIYLNGAILGMGRREIDRKFDEIVAFSEVERFIDTPVKHYSSGMYLRLAFAVAAHLEPDILIVDEVLAVGDVKFQQKCLGKMNHVASEGRTVLLVSHNMDAVRRLCRRAVLLEHGRVAFDGDIGGAVGRYLTQDGGRAAPSEWIDVSTRPRSGSGEVRFTAARYAGPHGGHPRPFAPLEITVSLESDVARTVDSLSLSIRAPGGIKLINADVCELGRSLRLEQGVNTIRFRIDALYLSPGVYPVGLWAGGMTGAGFDHVQPAFDLMVDQEPTDQAGIAASDRGTTPCRFDVERLAPESAG
jgi:lipopolysaccharide transport system ATP-binding protein